MLEQWLAQLQAVKYQNTLEEKGYSFKTLTITQSCFLHANKESLIRAMCEYIAN